MEVTFCHPRLGGGAHEVGGGHWNTLPIGMLFNEFSDSLLDAFEAVETSLEDGSVRTD